jgi:cytochrome c oxidase subunit IV
VLLLVAGVALMTRGGLARLGGRALLVWAVLATGLLVVTALGQSWERAADVATVIAALAVAVLAVPVLVGAAALRTVAARPVPVAPAGCAGCACGAGGCGTAS